MGPCIHGDAYGSLPQHLAHARLVRRRAQSVSGTMTFADGTQTDVNEATLLRPLEVALRAFSWGVVLLGLGLVAAKLS